jgi:hypothetical protein
MGITSIRSAQSPRHPFAAVVAYATLALVLAGYAQVGRADPPGRTTFSSGEAASQALYVAVRDDDEDSITRILGARRDIVFSDDEAQDKAERERFIQKYQQMHRLVREPDATLVLHIGAENWPFPIPLEAIDDGWQFDADAGMAQILFRRIGENEETAVEACRALVQAENGRKRAGDPSAQAIGVLLVNAGNEGPVVPFRGYYFRPLGQGKAAASRASNRKTSGSRFAFVAFPAEYRSTGVMTYLINQDGVVYEKDLGPNTVRIAKGMTRYRPDSTWHPADRAPYASDLKRPPPTL